MMGETMTAVVDVWGGGGEMVEYGTVGYWLRQRTKI